MPQVHEGSRGAIVIDDRYLPLVVNSFIGEIELDGGMWYEAKMGRLVIEEFQRGRRILTISDASRVVRTSPEMRRFWAELTNRHAASLHSKTLSNAVVVTSPVMRGVLTAVGWLNPQVADLDIYSSVNSAIQLSSQALARAGTPAPAPLGGYRLPPAAEHLFPSEAKRA